VPYHPPAEEPARDPGAAGDGVIRHGVGDRGPEPEMGELQTSGRPYSGLARVRSAGALVVGLDQNNLPFSTAHPAPAGLDYEVAGLLAEKLGVSLRVYWAYSAHDSYPSKLASKRLCDVILGVMPDDRFNGRVLFSRPYYAATYRLVTRTGEAIDPGRGVVGVEEGVAIRGLKDWAVRTYPSTDAVLEAVATGRVGAGYVISTRGPWLARKNWPGKLTFEPAPGPVDRFPIGAAVRKSDLDLKDAIDRALDELDGSGELARVFARWGIPYESATAHGTGDRP
jgi:ABC-type amino acid transport substrate-binding protein